MKKLNKYLMLFVAALALVGCVDDVVETPSTEISANVGDEVQFGVSLPTTRTVYGDKSDAAYALYWVDGDKVQIYSPKALEGRNNAEYKVVLPDNGDKAYYAKDLVKTGAYGVQWGEGDTRVINNVECTGVHDFYSVYPSGNTFEVVDGDIIAKNLKVDNRQQVKYVGGEFNNGFEYDMSNCLMYASTPGVVMTENNGVVNLKYTPISTVLEFELTASNENIQESQDFMIMGITLTADETIAGNFDFKATGVTPVSWGSTTSTSINISLTDATSVQGGNYTLTKGNTIKIPVFLAPCAFDISGWVISIVTNQGTFKKTLSKENVDEIKLAAGKIHKIKLPALKPSQEGWDVSTWMRYIPRNVYLSEISIPGTWNSLNSDFQNDTSIDNQYDLGVRAFHLDTRWSTTQEKNWAGNIKQSDLDKSKIYLATADGSGGFHIRSGTTALSTDYGQMMNPNTKSFATRLSQITDNVADDEYMVVFCTFTQGSYDSREYCPSTWYQAISDACENNDKVYDASTIDANSVVGDVLNHVIVVVNLDVPIDSDNLPADSKCLFTYVPMKLASNHYDADIEHYHLLYNDSGLSSGVTMYSSHSQISNNGSNSVDCGDERGYSHPLTKRDALVESIWTWSKDNYTDTAYAHDTWIYLGLGGYISTSSSGSGSGYDTIENRYGPKIYDRIEAMGKNNVPYYPVGIILMNNKKGSNYTDTNGNALKYGFSGVCEQILMLNNKYQLQFDPNKDVDYVNPNFSDPGDNPDDSEEDGF